MIHVGNQTSCWAATPTEPFAYALANGFDAFEWFPDKKPNAGWDEGDLDPTQRSSICEAGRNHGLRFSIHVPWHANPLRSESGDIFARDIALARDLGASLLNIHLEHETSLTEFLQAILPLIRNTADAGLELAIENTPYNSPEDFNQLFEQLRKLDSVPQSHVGMCLDLGHANLCVATRNDYLAFLARLKPDLPIIHLHLHENWGDADTHLPLFTGPSGQDDSGIRRLVEQLRQRQFRGSIILEQWPHPPSLLNQARDRLLGMLHAHNNSRSDLIGPIRQRISTKFATKFSRQGHSGQAVATEDTRLIEAIISADRHSRSWREKLDSVQRLLAEDDVPSNSEKLINIAIYLRFLATGEIPCEEDGRHFRPAHHARIALEIQRRLASLSRPDEVWLARRMLPWLPSSDQQFQRAEPLTRIRDIAHRNDIPQELKREIKVSLQNKLHRCASPEDLTTSARILERITTPGASYSPAFVEQFKIFHAELKEFFNAQSLEERLTGLLPLAHPQQAQLIRLFLEQKGADAIRERLAAFGSLTQLRRGFLVRVEQHPGPQAQKFLLADIGLEDFAFVLASQIRNQFDAGSNPPSWEAVLEVIVLLLANLELSSVQPEECRAIASELETWRRDLEPGDREQMLRLKASADRCRRLAEDFSDWIAHLFLGRAEKLGKALGVAEHAIRVFGEAEIRAHLVFQLSNLVAGLLRHLRQNLALPAWDVIVGGKASGRVMAVDRLQDLPPDQSEALLVLLTQAEGDEEIPKSVAGLVLTRSIPHLSHLAVRARQARVVLVAAEESAEFENVQRSVEKMAFLEASPDRVAFETGAHDPPGLSTARTSAKQIPEVQLASRPMCLSLPEVSLSTAGGKAYAARRLAELAQKPEAGFSVPPGVVVPFGVMELALAHTPDLKADYERRLRRFDELSPERRPAEAEQIRELLLRIAVPDEIVPAIAKCFPQDARLIVRSSANCEDLENLAGAGLYESIANVPWPDLPSAIVKVWASLWTARPALSRTQASIPHAGAHMAVLIQEMIVPDYAFVLHTVNPLNHHPDELYAELAVGLGETLVSARVEGTPYRFVCNKQSEAVSTRAFANYSLRLQPAPEGGVREHVVDYSQVELSRNSDLRQAVGRRLAAIGRSLERALGSPQDIEGVIVGDKIFVVQSRAQQGLLTHARSRT